MTEIPCPHCNEKLKVNPEALGSTLVCPKCHVILRLAKDDGEKMSRFDPRRLLRRRSVAVGLVCLLVMVAFVAGLNVGAGLAQGKGNNRGIVMNAFGGFVAYNELHINDGDTKTVTADKDVKKK